jgi:hypothetical protein
VVKQLFPLPGGDVDVDAALSLYGNQDRRAGPDRPYVVVNMVASIDGVTAVDGVSKALGSPTDRAIFLRLRDLADAIVVGAATARAERYGPARPTSAAQAARLERGQAARGDLGGEQRDAQVPAEADVVVHVVGGERVLEPVVAQVLDRLADLEAVGVGVGPGGVEHQRHVVADRVADGGADLDVEADRGRIAGRQPGAARRVNLVTPPALLLPVDGFLRVLRRGLVVGGGEIDGDAVPAGAEQAVDGQVRRLPGDVPEGDVDRADGVR